MPSISPCPIADAPRARPLMTNSVLLLDCTPARRADAQTSLAAAGVDVVCADGAAAAAVALARCDMPVVVDFARGAAALQVLRELRARRPHVLLVAIVDEARPDLATEAVLAGAADLVTPGAGGARVARVIRRAAARQAGEAPAVEDPSPDDVYGYSPAGRSLKAQIVRASAMRAGVLVQGEEGTGRAFVARAIHGGRPGSGPFVAVDCSTADGEPLAMALFGAPARDDDHLPARGLERVSRSGLLCAALGGTLYLERLADAPTRVQTRLARLLRDREAVLVETGAAMPVDVRCMAAADDRFEGAVKDGRVQEDLYRRLSAARVDVPPLRERREDVAAVANVLMRAACAARGVPPKQFSRSALALLAALPWRGHVAELRRLMQAIAEGSASRGLSLEELLGYVRLDAGSVMLASGGTLRQARARFERQYITTILQQHHGRIAQTARALGMQRTNLYRKMRMLRVAQPRPR